MPTAERECDHIWTFVSDWEGDPNVINGTHDLSHFECSLCGETREVTDAEIQREQDRAQAWAERQAWEDRHEQREFWT